MKLLPLPELTSHALTQQSVSELTQRAIRLVITCLEEVCAGVADDCDEDLRHDDSTSEGLLRWRRCRNYVKKLLDAKAIEGLEEAVADVSDNALRIRLGDVAVAFYSSRNGIDHPHVGGSNTKKAFVTEMQLQLDLDPGEEPENLVVIYEADQDGLAKAAVGVMRTEIDWAWRYSAYARGASHAAADDTQSGKPAQRTYEDEPEAELPPLEILPDQSDLDAEAEQ